MTTATVLAFFAMLLCSGCATPELETDNYELLSLRSLPKGNELKDECTCLNENIDQLNAFAEKMRNSRYSMHYHAMSQQKISLIRERANEIGCKYPR